MFLIDQIILLAAVLILLGIVSSKLSARLGLPVLVMFLMVGMLAGEDGPGGIFFDNAAAAHSLGTLALAMILFDGGLQTPLKAIKKVWKPASVLATLGVLITSAVTGVAAAYMLDIPLLQGLLFGAIVGSTDAAAVFALLRNAGIHLNTKLKATLEIESASNDPMAIFLTVGLLEVLVNDMKLGTGLLLMFVSQMGLGALVGLAVGWSSVKLINKIQLVATGLYPVLVAACGLLSFGITANIGGSGFLAVFITGVVIGNSRFVFQRSTFLFHDGLAWLGQITMFVVLGLLINPTSLLDVWFEGLIIALVLIFIARPLAVIPVLALFGFKAREITLVSWVGLRGSVPIILAIFPLMFGLPGAELIFNVVFFVVLISATLQGSTLALMARKLKLTLPPPVTPAATLEITALGDVDADIVEYTIGKMSRAVGRRLSQLALPDSTVMAMISRNNNIIAPRGSTLLQADDQLFMVLKPHTREFVDCVFSSTIDQDITELSAKELRVKGNTSVASIAYSYDIHIAAEPNDTLEQVLKTSLNSLPKVDDFIELDDVKLTICEMVGDRIITVGIIITLDESLEE
ncbi:cell volume regulation protein A [Pseudoalteromonas nigrifaciens]|jgi:cell volume regulation protein A|uniref:Cell volume regulation protein A n=3 Tax=Pseudoalteromonas nigrifaciens TaxID=28109 RepID=A0AAC9ULE4_9GAMM|nr:MULTISPECIES: potassium/proton antiporter [Pseudoalteromonas]ASM55778.1 cell volume regulation protein A [Pseudoalteromonas nigrifaciens]MBB1371282.1 potassium/proton antiporter [Pseudoalteromonas sp. SR45-4]MBE0421559.1 potassium/proton antiporter [Pseudoalteromonas nigrifaciens]NYR14267.1 potassium/proton antiporter [Pseudoalteromonas sp. MIP2626]SUD22913.1 potassium/proton antiporter [Pseudoalteromonas nigrifaciens]|tara:strand:+ start:1341 stop:3068 length:1728 start_codon:yes stop_codon:yes gene_type:complete